MVQRFVVTGKGESHSILFHSVSDQLYSRQVSERRLFQFGYPKDTIPMHYLEAHHADSIAQRVQRRLVFGALLHGLKVFVGVLLLGFCVFVILSAPAQWQRARYWLDSLRVGAHQLVGSELDTTHWISPSRFLREPMFEMVDVVAAPPLDPNTLFIPAIDLSAPIGWDVPLVEALNGLQQGVVQAKESVLPGEVGRTFVVGHSAGYWWARNPWTRVFALLDKLKNDDLIFVRRTDQVFAFKVTGSTIVSPDQVQVVRDEALDHNQLALMTCTPVGTTLNRLIVFAEPLRVE